MQYGLGGDASNHFSSQNSSGLLNADPPQHKKGFFRAPFYDILDQNFSWGPLK